MKIIESVTIRYFRSIYTITLSPCEDITVITGKNDVGKSNLIKALNLFFCQQSDYLKPFDFLQDYSMLRKEEVKKDTIRGQQFISISIKFARGERMQNSLPPSFSVTRRWDMHSPEYKQTTDVYVRMSQYAKKNGLKYSEKTTSMFLSMFLNRIKFIYIPAIKDDRVFNETLNWLQQSLFDEKNKAVLDAPIGNANTAVQEIVGDLQNDFMHSTGIPNFVELPNTLNYAKGLLQINTATRGGTVTIDKRGDGIRTHYIPKILNYVAEHSKNIYIWGFEEPENSYEYRRCIQVAEEFDQQYSKNCQIFITSHSPAFYNRSLPNKRVIHVGCKDSKTILIDDDAQLDEELGYIELYREFLDRVKKLQSDNLKKQTEIDSLVETLQATRTPLILTEGKTDAALLQLAIQKLGLKEFEHCVIKPILSGQTTNNVALLNFLREVCDNVSLSFPIIGVFDRDVPLNMVVDGMKIDIRSYEYLKLSDKVYAFSIPVPHNRPEADQISIEHYFTNSEIKTEKDGKRLFMGNEFYETGVYRGDEEYYYKGASQIHATIKIIEHETRCFVTRTDGSGDYSLSKAGFVKCIENNDPGFEEISFSEFKKIFEVIGKILHESA